MITKVPKAMKEGWPELIWSEAGFGDWHGFLPEQFAAYGITATPVVLLQRLTDTNYKSRAAQVRAEKEKLRGRIRRLAAVAGLAISPE